MSGDSILDRYLNEPPRPTKRAAAPPSTEVVEASERYVAMLDCVLGNGNRVALPYAMLLRAEFDPSKGITLRYSTEDVEIAGYRLEPVYRAIVQHRAREIKETSRQSGFESEQEGSGPVITAIRCRPASELAAVS